MRIVHPHARGMRTARVCTRRYVVQAGLKAYFHTYEVHFLVQGTSKPPEHVTQSILAFVETIPAIIANQTNEQFASLVASSRSQLLEKPHSVTDKADGYFDEIAQRCYEFTRPQKIAHTMQRTTVDDLKALARRLLSRDQGVGRLLTRVYGGAQEPMPADLHPTLPKGFSLLTDVDRLRSKASYLDCNAQAAALAETLRAKKEVSELGMPPAAEAA